MRSLFCAISLFFISIGVLPAQILVLDLGPNPTSAPQKTNLPYNTGISSTSTFNTVTSANSTSGNLLLSDGTSDSSLSLTFGEGDGTAVTFLTAPTTTQINTTALTGGGFSAPSGIFQPGSAAVDGFFGNSSGHTSLGVSIGGLAAGTYEIFMGGRNTNSGGVAAPETFFTTATSATPTSQDTSLLTGTGLTNTTTASFIQGDNYVELTQTITAGQSLNFYVTGATSTAEKRAFLNFAEIVPMTVPEPNAFALVASGLGALALMRRFSVSRRA